MYIHIYSVVLGDLENTTGRKAYEINCATAFRRIQNETKHRQTHKHIAFSLQLQSSSCAPLCVCVCMWMCSFAILNFVQTITITIDMKFNRMKIS